MWWLGNYIGFCTILLLVTVCNAADILFILPTASYSHQIPFRPLIRELCQRGHNITLVTTDPMRDPTLTNLKEIDISYGYEILNKKYRLIEIVSNESISFYEMAKTIRKITNETNTKFFESPEGQNLIHNSDNHFDLLIVEALLPAMMIYSWKYQIPFIGVSSLDCAMQYHDSAGNPTNPIINPDPNLPIENLNQMAFMERLKSVAYTVIYKGLVHFLTFPREQNMLKHYFGEDVPPISEIQNNISMLFIITNPIFNSIRPLMPNTITIGNGMHIHPPKGLPEDVKEFLGEAKVGAIYFSLGSNIKEEILNHSTKTEILNAFASLPYNFLWKIDYEFRNLPPNIKVKKWFDQQDILRHPNVKAFITQGGLQSMQESINFDVPMIGIPFFGDQHMNVKRMVHLGYGIKVDKHNITRESIKDAITEIISNPRYSEKAREYGAIFRDVEVPNVDKAVWWTEYVIRHKGARHFRNPMLDLPFWKIYMLDVLGFVLGVILFVIFILRTCIRLIFKCLRRRKNVDMKKKTK